jgi:hypothetical protein
MIHQILLFVSQAWVSGISFFTGNNIADAGPGNDWTGTQDNNLTA